MIKVGISVEGNSEALFANYVLKRYLYKYGIDLKPAVNLGGNITKYRVSKILSLMSDYYDYVTSIYDFYGFADKNDSTHEEIVFDILNSPLCENKNNIIPYIQVHEFEAILFSDVKVLSENLYYNNKKASEEAYINIKESINGLAPEEINDSPETAPSKRIKKFYRRYKKSIHGYTIAQDIGIEKIMEECPIFKNWVEKLKGLSNTQKIIT